MFGSKRRVLRLWFSAVVACVLVSCSLQSDEEAEAEARDARYKPAGEVCGGALSATALRHLESATGADEFMPSLKSGDATDFSSLLRVLREAGEYEQPFCRIQASTSEPTVPVVGFYFEWEPAEHFVRPEKTDLWRNTQAAFYDVGEWAMTLGPRSAFLAFECSVEGREGQVLSSRLSITSLAYPDDRIGLLNAVSRTVAEGLGCLEESGLTDADPREMARRGTPGANGSGVPDDAQSP